MSLEILPATRTQNRCEHLRCSETFVRFCLKAPRWAFSSKLSRHKILTRRSVNESFPLKLTSLLFIFQFIIIYRLIWNWILIPSIINIFSFPFNLKSLCWASLSFSNQQKVLRFRYVNNFFVFFFFDFFESFLSEKALNCINYLSFSCLFSFYLRFYS